MCLIEAMKQQTTFANPPTSGKVRQIIDHIKSMKQFGKIIQDILAVQEDTMMSMVWKSAVIVNLRPEPESHTPESQTPESQTPNRLEPESQTLHMHEPEF